MRIYGASMSAAVDLLGTLESVMAVSCSLLIAILPFRMGDKGMTVRVSSFLPALRIWVTCSETKLSSLVPSMCVTTSPGKSGFRLGDDTSACWNITRNDRRHPTKHVMAHSTLSNYTCLLKTINPICTYYQRGNKNKDYWGTECFACEDSCQPIIKKKNWQPLILAQSIDDIFPSSESLCDFFFLDMVVKQGILSHKTRDGPSTRPSGAWNGLNKMESDLHWVSECDISLSQCTSTDRLFQPSHFFHRIIHWTVSAGYKELFHGVIWGKPEALKSFHFPSP